MPTERDLATRTAGRARGGRRAVGALLAVVAWALASALPAAGAPRPRVTVIGDSVSASIEYVPAARHLLGQGLDLRLDLRVCRRLVAASCSYGAVIPSTALEAVRGDGASLGRVVLVDVGYNDDAARYARDMDEVLRALRTAGVARVVWVTNGGGSAY